ncbi:hypothetical protein JX265_000741 [Neoarthrinium moseri]|uniref:N-acetyltransferase domain-containing protein n=1 Tax=Neoarthrinium moseri TaxID=1658444 RepID=A0A9P9WWI8_9PEZI|nr:uncharacterized protein JN550_007151 [Neoarthrinium moseri]KAI1847491.1 hypothetical protein JX266_006343 [Neoarthrinium moseri]KAI1867420.1 hypothetical protein JN550_007151 [Neoarthrinium moseri]KAI1880501.1 hypothetical protein JX265_000741 [Neoarthrinium moseri]
MAFAFPPTAYEIKSPRLVIRTPTVADAGAFIELLGNVKNLPLGETGAMKDLTIDSISVRIEKWRKLASEGRGPFLAVALRHTDEVIGYMAFNCFRTKDEYEGTEPEREHPLPGPEGRYLTDLGIVMDHRHRRKGYSSEVICMASEFAFNSLGCQVVRMETGIANEPWRSLMRSMGFGAIEEKGAVSYAERPIGWLYKVDKITWQQTERNLKANEKWPL